MEARLRGLGNMRNVKAAQQLLTPYLPEACGKQNVEDLYMLLTDVPKEESVVICTGRHAGEMLRSGFEKEPVLLPGRLPSFLAADSCLR